MYGRHTGDLQRRNGSRLHNGNATTGAYWEKRGVTALSIVPTLPTEEVSKREASLERKQRPREVYESESEEEDEPTSKKKKALKEAKKKAPLT